MLLMAVAARAEVRSVDNARAHELVLNASSRIASAGHSLVATALATLPPEEKPKTHWPWWLRILSVIGVLVFIRLVAGSVRNDPGRPGPSGS
jgi:hypothetical protein